jgi:phenylacetate-CoA ligase
MSAAFYLPFRRTLWALKRYPAHQIASLLDETQWWPKGTLEHFRNEKLARLIDHCYQQVPYYRRVMVERGLKPSDIRSARDLNKLPVLTKDVVRQNWEQLRANNLSDRNIFIAATGGSTGEPMKIAKAFQNEAWANMCFERGISWGGLTPGMKRVVLTGGSVGYSKKTWRERMSRRVSGQINLLAYDLWKMNVHEYIDVIRRSGSQFIIGYASNIYHLARMVLERGEKLNLQAVFTTAERLLPGWRATIGQAMNCRVYSYYGCGECNSIGYQCQEGETYHIAEEHVVLEVDAELGRTDPLGSGQALITDLDNYAMPLLRYQNGDYITLGNKNCDCGRSLGLISKLEGRTYEFLLSTSKGLVSAGICDVILGNVTSIAEFQVRQDQLSHIRVLLVLCRELSDQDNAYIRKAFRYYLGDTMDVEIQIVAEIPRTKAQKLQTAINELAINGSA